MPTSSVHCECFQFGGCDAALNHCALQTVLVSLVLPTRTPEAMMKLPIAWNSGILLGIRVLSPENTIPLKLKVL